MVAEVNTCLKFLIGHKAMKQLTHVASNMAFALIALRLMRQYLNSLLFGMIQHDMMAHFDWMYPEMAIGGRHPHSALNQQNYCWFEAECRDCNGRLHGVLANGAPQLGGMVQGKADVPQLSTNTMLKARKTIARGLCIHSPLTAHSISHHSIAFTDDTDGHVSTPTDLPSAITDAILHLQHSAQTWSTLMNICGGLIALHKCNCQLIAWQNRGGVLTLIETPPQTLYMHDRKGACARVDYLPPNKPNVGLGYLLCPNGNQHPQSETLYDSIGKLCNSVAIT